MSKSGKYLKFIPSECRKSVKNIDFFLLYKKGYRVLSLDIDNTLVSYQEAHLNPNTKQFIHHLEQMGFLVVFISNNHKPRVETFLEGLTNVYQSDAKKPLKKGFKALMAQIGNPDPKTVVHVGDQLLTDVYGANRMGFYTILVEPILKKSDILPTRINRRIEKFVLNRIKKHQPTLYKERFLHHG